ncbi:hypothetical protein QFC21_000305 [Naganishia friedmannii]|uniref:Uncharacterized protein n=1 Tax=Naganishia friedmannii TaxID=89922 RepID=A0ACC2WBF6_9TREE|nr:hypothetical protein QFC21_000305 [Naganishia friedmannii]
MGKTLYVPTNVAKEEDEHPGAGSHYVSGRIHPGIAKAVQLVQDKDFAALLKGREEVLTARSADELLHTGIADYTFIPGAEGILGKGKFSTVYKVKGLDGKFYALKHTPLYPHHPLIAARLLREPTLLAQIPPHPCLIGVQGWIKTPDHFYLVEDLSSEHVPLSELPTPLENISLVRKILDQLVSVVRDGLHRDGRVCHRDLKAENILINDHGDLVLLGVYRYYGPELDIWCIGLTMLALLTGRRYPIGASHTHLEVMAHNVKECLQEVDHIHKHLRGLPRSTAGSDIDRMQAQDDWDTVRDAVEEFLLIDGNARISAFERYQLDECIQKHVANHKVKVEKLRFKTISFETAPLKYTLPMTLQTPKDPTFSMGMDGLRLRNVRLAPTHKVHSYIKYLLRSSGYELHITAMCHDASE